MSKYPRTSIPSVISVRSIVTVWHFCLQHQTSAVDVHDHPEILYVEEGSHPISIDGVPMVLSAGQMVIYGPNAQHCGTIPSDAIIDIVSFEVDSTILDSFYNHIITLNSRQKAILSQLITIGTDLFDRLRYKYGFINIPLGADIQNFELQRLKNELELFLLDIYSCGQFSPQASGVSNTENAKATHFELFQQYLKSQLHRQLTMEQIADVLSMSTSSLTKLCQAQCGCSPMAYFIQLKIEAAKRMICQTTMNYTEIAEALGYTSVHYFSKQFKNKTGKSPSEFARSVLKK